VVLLVVGQAVISEASVRLGPRPKSWILNAAPIPAEADSVTDSVPGSNTIIDFLYAPPDLWAATARGVSRQRLRGGGWITYSTDEGLGAYEIPALGIFGSGVWAATSHAESREGNSIPWGDGIFLLDEATGQWIDRSPTFELSEASIVEQASGPSMLCFDLAEFRGGIVGACFAGGLVLSMDEGQTWRNIFTGDVARGDFTNQYFTDLNNRFFSVVVDSSAPDSMTIYAGTAWGINKYIFLRDTLKVTGFDFRDLAIDGGRLFAATESGMSVTPTQGGSWRTYYESDGLPSDYVSAVAANGDTIWVGLESADGTEGLGVAWSIDNGATWNVPDPQPVQVVGTGRNVRAITIAEDVVWLACGGGGLLQYSSGSSTWTPYLDGGEVLSLFALQGEGDSYTLHVGTDDGIVRLAGALDSPWDTIAVGILSDNISQRVIDMAYQPLPCDTMDEEAAALWALVRESDQDTSSMDGWAVSTDEGNTWTVSSRRLPVNDVAFLGCRYYLASDSGLVEGNYDNLDSVVFTASFEAKITAGDVGRRAQALQAVITKDGSGFDSLAVLWVATDSGLAFSANATLSWGVVFSNPDPSEFDLIYNYHNRNLDTAGEFAELSGNFIPALALQPTSGKPVLWAATRGTGQGRYTNDFSGYTTYDGISFTRDGGSTWTVPDLDSLFGMPFQVWNFAFDGNRIWAASSQGLLGSLDGISWTLQRNFTDPSSGATVDSTIEILGVEIVDDELWVGTENGMIVLDQTGSEVKQIRRTFRAVDADDPGSEGGVYATPTPYSPRFNLTRGGARLHYTPPVSGDVTITIYDFANRVVKVLTDGEHRDAGVQYNEADIWDGRNGEGDFVAVGTYFFVIEYSNGEVQWGKIAVIP
jgi:hypothetical protein